MKKKFYIKCLFSFGLLLFFTFLPQIMPTQVSIARASEIEKEKNNDYRLNLRALTLPNGKSFTLRVFGLEEDAKVSFKSADSDIASIDEDGTLTANKSGSTTITATVRRGLITTPLICEVTTGPPAFSVKLTRSRIILEVEQSIQLEALVKPINTVELVKFYSPQSEIAAVTPGGRVKAIKPGVSIVEAKIDATNPDGNQKVSLCSVIIAKPEDVTPLYDYFALRPELKIIPETDLSNALSEIINEYYLEKVIVNNPTSASASPGVQKTQNDTQTDTSDTTNTQKELSLIETLDKQLNLKFNLIELKQKYDERYQRLTVTQP